MWLILLLTIAGLLGGIGGYMVGLREPSEEFDEQLRQLALYIGADVGTKITDTKEASDIEPEDIISLRIWDRDGKLVRASDAGLDMPRRTATGFSDATSAGDDWRVYTLERPDRTVQIAQRTQIRKELAAESALRAVYPVAAVIPLSWLLIGLVVSRVLRPLMRLVGELASTQAGSGGELSLVGLPREITPLVEAVNDLLARQKALLDFRQRFLSDTAHQLRTPLTAAKLQSENMRHAVSVADARELSTDIGRGLTRMSDMINRLLDLARTDAPDRPKPTESHDLNAIIREALEDVVVPAGRKSIDLGMTAQAHAPVVCDRDEVRMLVGNLLDNAVRYTPEDGQVDIALDVSGRSARVEVKDTGPGIPDADLGALFDRFARFGKADTEGSGLGLAIVKAIAARHAARVEVRNRLDRSGLSAVVVFPLTTTAG
jgi:signal transduction histidine kinase